jgi:very-short-patch-repair endonuclease
LANLPYGQHLLPGSSVYDLGSTMFSQDVIRLREHFRCVEPIIAFSNRQFYNDGIKPLRVPTPSERLDPPLIDVFVKGGYRQDRKKINKPEANAIVEEIQRLTEDPSTDNRTIGVVSLLGWEQAKYIQDRILDTLGEDVFLRHKIRCGDAMHFQGKEADIVMVSMVAAGSIRADSGRTYEQRYNVACSRARDRMYVFHSFTRGDVNDNDLRARLLDHLAQPLGGASEEAQELQELCDSDFEREVFDELVTRGYRVTPQVGAGGFRIDLVVEGAQDRRLAIECDGDQYHGVERWMEDVSRQRILERMGWRFWRCWASSWISTREECLDDLVGTLTKLGIEPWEGSSDAGSSSIVERRTIEPETAVMSDSAEGQEPYVEAVEAAGEVVQDEPAIPSDLPTEPKVA